MKVLIIFLINFMVIYELNATNKTNNNAFNEYLLASNLGNNFFNYLSHKKFDMTSINDTKCIDQIARIPSALLNKEEWAFNIVDAWGKVPSGIKYGNLMELGNFDECLNVKSLDTNEAVQGKYCMAHFPIDNFFPNAQKITYNQQFRASPFKSLRLSIGICIPETCSNEFLENVLLEFVKDILPEPTNIKIEIPNTSCTKKQEIKFRRIDIIAIAFFSKIGLIILLSSVYDYLMQKLKKKPISILIAFSVLTNGRKLFAIPKTSSPETIKCLNGLRCMSIIWVVFGHSYVMVLNVPMINKSQLIKWTQTPYSMLLQTGQVSIDTFFFLGGFLVAWAAFKEMEKSKGKLNILLMYFHRYIRLTPVVAVIIFFYVSLLRYVGTGPLWNTLINPSIALCEQNWWATLLYIMNYATPNNMCLGFTWYLAIDVQLYLLSPLLIIPAWKWGSKFLLPTTLILSLISIISTFVIYMKYDFSMSLFDERPENALGREMTYLPTHTRYSPWLVGFFCAYYIFIHRLNKIKLSKAIVLFGWIAAFSLMLVIIFGTYPKTQPGAVTTTLEAALFQSCHRFAWSLAIGWIVFACHNGYGGFVNSFLSYPYWQVLGRLTYSIYIVHMIVQNIRIGTLRSPYYFSDYTIMNIFWGDFGFTMIIAIGIMLAFESPIVGIEKAIFGQKKKDDNFNSIKFGKPLDETLEKPDSNVILLSYA